MSLAQQLKDQTAAVKLRRTVFGVRKRLSPTDRRRAADTFHTQQEFLSASKKLLDTSEPTYKAVTGTIGRARSYWKSMTVFYPVRGIRLIRKDLIDVFEAQMKVFEGELKSSLDQMCARYSQLKQHAREKLGDLFHQGDYPGVEDLRDEFSLSWEYPSTEPPDFLKQLNPKLYEQEQQRVAARFEEALATAEQAMATELQKLVEGLCDRLAPSDGKKRNLTPSAINGLNEFVARFRQLNVRSGSELESIVTQAEKLTQGLDPSELKKAPDKQGALFSEIDVLRNQLDQMVVDAPTRKITLTDEDDE